jgi:redox-sensitive bicupin YhaK (pirin superfamily)
MMQLRPSEARGHANFGWLDSRHSFSFGHYHDPAHMGFGPLRVINEDRVAPAAGFDTHGHADMEIISYVLDGALEHKDSLGTGSVIRPGDVQRMSAGTGVRHSEFNASKTDPVHFLQIWVIPERKALEPSYDQRHFPEEERRNALKLVASGTPRDGALKIHQDADIHASLLDAGPVVAIGFWRTRGQWRAAAPGRRAGYCR